jgi:hypothetical protein
MVPAAASAGMSQELDAGDEAEGVLNHRYHVERHHPRDPEDVRPKTMLTYPALEAEVAR